jgi:hypothetical protein
VHSALAAVAAGFYGLRSSLALLMGFPSFLCMQGKPARGDQQTMTQTLTCSADDKTVCVFRGKGRGGNWQASSIAIATNGSASVFCFYPTGSLPLLVTKHYMVWPSTRKRLVMLSSIVLLHK